MICHPLPFYLQRFACRDFSMCSLLLSSILWAPDVHAVCHKLSLFIPVFISAAALSLEKLVLHRPAPSPGRSFGELANTCWGSSQPRSGVSICTRCSWPIISRFHSVELSNPLTAPLSWAPTCFPWAVQPSHQGSTQQSRDEGGLWGWFLLGGGDGCLSSPGEADKPFLLSPHVLKSTGATTQNLPACKAL